MLTQTRWKESFEFQPWNPTQKAAEHYTGLPGGYSTFYYNHVPNETALFGPDLGVADMAEVPEAYGTIPGVYGPLGVETAQLVPAGGLPPPGIYDPSQHLEVLLNDAMGLGATADPMSSGTKMLWIVGAVAVGVVAGVVGSRMMG